MQATPILSENARCESQDSPGCLPVCPFACGPLNYHGPDQPGDGGSVTCPTCGWKVYLTADEARDLTAALLGITPDLPLDLFITAVAQRAYTEQSRDWQIADETVNGLQARWQALCDMSATTYRAWQEMDAEETEQSKDLQRMGDALARLRGVPIQTIWAENTPAAR